MSSVLRRATVPSRFQAVTTTAARNITRIGHGHSRYSRLPVL
jgi:hypothetical protein